MGNETDFITRRANLLVGGTPLSVMARLAQRFGASRPSPEAAARQALLDRAIAETEPLVAPGTSYAPEMAETIQRGTARNRPLTDAVALRIATERRKLSQVVGGLNPKGQAAEIVVMAAIDANRAGVPDAMVNPPPPPQTNELGHRQSPDCISMKDLLVRFRRTDGSVGVRYTSQVKVGEPNKYVAPELAGELGLRGMPGYGRVAVVDARLVEPDGSPRVGEGAFSANSANKIKEAGVTLRGVPDLDAKAELLVDDVKRFGEDGLGPVDREATEYVWTGLRCFGHMLPRIALRAAMSVDPIEMMEIYYSAKRRESSNVT